MKEILGNSLAAQEGGLKEGDTVLKVSYFPYHIILTHLVQLVVCPFQHLQVRFLGSANIFIEIGHESFLWSFSCYP